MKGHYRKEQELEAAVARMLHMPHQATRNEPPAIMHVELGDLRHNSKRENEERQL